MEKQAASAGKSNGLQPYLSPLAVWAAPSTGVHWSSQVRHVDMVTDYYLEFYTDKDGKLEIRPGGTDFFSEAREKLLRDVAEKDKEKVRGATDKPNLMRWIGQEETEALSFMKTGDRGETAYILQTIKTRGSDDHHIVIGVRQE